MVKFTTEELRRIMDYKHNIRNMSVSVHADNEFDAALKVFKGEKKRNVCLINLIDLLGRDDFCSRVTAALDSITDGALVVVDRQENHNEHVGCSIRENKDKQDSSSLNESEDKERLDNILEKMDRFIGLTAEKMKLSAEKLELRKDKQRNDDMRLLWFNIDHLTGQDRENAEKVKQDIREKYGM